MLSKIRCFRFLFALLVVLALPGVYTLPAQTATAIAAPSWNPAKTWVFIVGVLKWQKSDTLASFDDTGRKDTQLRDFFLHKGVPADHVAYIGDTQAKLHNIEKQLDDLLRRTDPGDFLFAYYCGHGWIDNGTPYFGNYDASDDPSHCWSMNSFVDELTRKFNGSTALITVDCCHSGSIAGLLNRAHPMWGYGTLTSAVSSESSTSNWTFTNALLDSLNGHRYADYDHNGVITYTELARYIRSEMADLEQQTAGAAHSLNFDPQFQIAAVQFKNEPIPQKVEVNWKGTWYPAKLMEKNDRKAKIHWIQIGWDAPEDDQWVDLIDVREIKSKDAVMPAVHTGQYQIGAHVQIKWEGRWYPGAIEKFKNGSYYIHYDGYSDDWDEWVDDTRLRPGT